MQNDRKIGGASLGQPMKETLTDKFRKLDEINQRKGYITNRSSNKIKLKRSGKGVGLKSMKEIETMYVEDL